MPESKKAQVGEVKQAAQEVATYIKLVDKVRKSKSEHDVNVCFNAIEKMLKPRMRNLCSKFRIPGLTYDDIYQEALVALRYKAIKDYDKTRGSGEGPAPFDRFALLCIRRHLATELKTSHQVRKKVLNGAISLDQHQGDFNDDLSLINIIPQTKGDVLRLIERKEYHTKLVKNLIAKLSKFEREVFMLFIERYTYEEIKGIINDRRQKTSVNVKSVDNALSRIKNKADCVWDKHGDKDIRERDATQAKKKRKSPDAMMTELEAAIGRIADKCLDIIQADEIDSEEIDDEQLPFVPDEDSEEPLDDTEID